jgi:hypothetical protein
VAWPRVLACKPSAYGGAAEAPACTRLEAPGATGDEEGTAVAASGVAAARLRTGPLRSHVQLQVSFLFVKPFVHVSQSST